MIIWALDESILVVEDDKDIRQMYAEVLQSNGFSVYTAFNGTDAIEKYKETKPDLVFMDSEMPEVDGVEAFEKIKGFDNNAKVVMITGYSDNDKRFENAIENGLEAIITKPVGLNQILDLVKKYLS